MLLLLGFLFGYGVSPRSISQMRSKAIDKAGSTAFMSNNEHRYESFRGPFMVVDTSHSEFGGIEFVWYSVLDWGDTAQVSAKVTEQSDLYYHLLGQVESPWLVNANSGYSYFRSGKQSDLMDLLPPNHSRDVGALRPYRDSDYEIEGVTFLKPLDLLYRFLEEGYFVILGKNEEFTVVEFYDNIARIRENTEDSTTLEIKVARVIVNAENQVMIVPFRIPQGAMRDGLYKF